MPCRMIAPIYEDLARNKGIRVGNNGVGAAFTKIDMSTPMGNQLASEWGVRVMPTFMFFLDGKKVYFCEEITISRLTNVHRYMK